VPPQGILPICALLSRLLPGETHADRLLILACSLRSRCKRRDTHRHRSGAYSTANFWNHHDLENFMAGYWKSPDLTFFGTHKTSGWQATLDRYRKTYQGERPTRWASWNSPICRSSTCSGRGVCSRQVKLTLSRWQDAARIVHPRVSPVSRRMEDRARPHFAGTVNRPTGARGRNFQPSPGGLCHGKRFIFEQEVSDKGQVTNLGRRFESVPIDPTYCRTVFEACDCAVVSSRGGPINFTSVPSFHDSHARNRRCAEKERLATGLVPIRLVCSGVAVRPEASWCLQSPAERPAPALVCAQTSIFDHFKVERTSEECERFIIIPMTNTTWPNVCLIVSPRLRGG